MSSPSFPRILARIFLGALGFAPTLARATIETELGVSYFDFEHARFETAPAPLSVDESGRAAPLIVASYAWTEQFVLRLSYQFINNVEATTQFGSPPSPLPVVVSGHYQDDIHILGLAPEFRLAVAPAFTFAIAPQLNRVASRGMVSYSSPSALILFAPPRERNEDGFTFGGGIRLFWSAGRRVSVTLGYQYLDLEPSFNREAHVFSGGLRWKF